MQRRLSCLDLVGRQSWRMNTLISELWRMQYKHLQCFYLEHMVIQNINEKETLKSYISSNL